MMIRTPAVAGMFYPDTKNELERSITNSFLHKLGPQKLPPTKNTTKVYGIICPHAGYMYSGPIASHSIFAISSQPKKLFIIIGPNHWGIGCSIATMTDCKWQTPLGEVEVDSDTAREISGFADIIEVDFFSHSREHSLEVQIPWLQQYFSNFKILPITMISQDKTTAKKIGRAVAKIVKNHDAMIIGSSDFTHYEPNEFAYKQDKALIEPILKMDVDEFYDVLHDKKVTACGYGAIASTMVACKEIGALKGELLKYATSGDVTGEKSSVVGYGSVIFT